jgi:hypothetical protein
MNQFLGFVGIVLIILGVVAAFSLLAGPAIVLIAVGIIATTPAIHGRRPPRQPRTDQKPID